MSPVTTESKQAIECQFRALIKIKKTMDRCFAVKVFHLCLERKFQVQ
jgi:hypothetical protein